MFGVILYRVVISAVLFASGDEVIKSRATIIASVTAACINFVIILILNFVSMIIDVCKCCHGYWYFWCLRLFSDNQIKIRWLLYLFFNEAFHMGSCQVTIHLSLTSNHYHLQDSKLDNSFLHVLGFEYQKIWLAHLWLVVQIYDH